MKARLYIVSPEDHSRGRGGFNGEYFTVTGVTCSDFATEEDACAAIQRKHPSWVRSDPENMSGPVFTHPGKAKHLVVRPVY